MAKRGLETKATGHATMASEARIDRDMTPENKLYIRAVKLLTADVNSAIDQAIENPELGLEISKICTRFVLKSMPDPAQDPGRATSLSQCQTLEDCLAKVRTPDVYLEEMKRQFGPDLDPRQYPASQDAFNSIIKSQRNKIYAEGKGLNTVAEQNFCRKRGDLLIAVEKGYNQLRDKAMGIDRTPNKGMGR